jgi:acyl-CoA reductase-like NAD-dependent aldehyde dehydrogenase
MTDTNPLLEAKGLFIDGSWVEGAGRIDDVDPTTEEVFAAAPDADVGQVATAIAAARAAADDGRWSDVAPDVRSKCLAQLSEALFAHRDHIVELSMREWGCTENAQLLQLDAPAFMTQRASELALDPREEQVETFGAAGRTLIRHEPQGVVSILTPWNFPHTINTMKVSTALAAGNTVVLKPSPLTPLAGLALARIVEEHTDIPEGVVNVVTTSSLEASQSLVTDPRVDMVSFTGSSAVGQQIMALGAPTMKRVLLELGGKSACVLLDDVGLDEVLPGILFDGCTLHAGQACILTSRLLVPEALHDDVVDRLAALAGAVVVGDPKKPGTEMGPLISAEHRERVEGHIARAIADGARVVSGGGRPAGIERGYFVEPTVITGVEPDSHLAQEEVFGPVLSVITFRDADEAVRIANDSAYGLSGSVWGTDDDQAVEVARRIRTGMITVNGSHPGDAPFGGFKQSGIGREGGPDGLLAYTETKAIGAPA